MKTLLDSRWNRALLLVGVLSALSSKARGECNGSGPPIPSALETVAQVAATEAKEPQPVTLDEVPPSEANANSLAFQLDRRMTVGSGPVSVAGGHFDSDTYPDIASANYGAGSVTVLLQGVDGRFSNHREIALPGKPVYVGAGDLDGDGFDDLVAPMFYENAVAVLISDGGGSFHIEHVYPTGPGPTATALADLDSDGDLDLAISNFGDNTVSIFLNRKAEGESLMELSGHYVVGLGPQHVVAADFTGDGLVDLATADGGCLTVSVLPNRGSGRFGPRISTLIPSPALSLAAADFDGDGDIDLVAASYSVVQVLSNDSRARFVRAATLQPRSGQCMSVAAADLDADGMPEVLAVSFTDSWSYRNQQFVTVFDNQRGSFLDRKDYGTGAFPFQVIAFDLDGDTDPDVVTANYGRAYWLAEPSVSVLENLQGKRLASNAEYGTPRTSLYDCPECPIASVFAAVSPIDRETDLLVSRRGEVQRMRNSGAGLFERPSIVARGSIRAVRDLDDDGIPDLIITNAETLEVHIGDMHGGFSRTGQFPSATFLALLDVNRDGLPEIAASYAMTPDFDRSDEVVLLPNLGHGRFGARLGTGLVSSAAVEGADVDGDGFDDLLIGRRGLPGSDTIIVLGNQHGRGFHETARALTHPEERNPYTYQQRPGWIRCLDFDHDGLRDLVVLGTSPREGGGYLSIIRGLGEGGFGLADFEQDVGAQPVGMVLGDLDQDGKIDAVVADRYPDGPPGRAYVFHGTEIGQVDRGTTHYFDPYLIGITGGDFDHDGMEDVAVASGWSATVSVLLNGSMPAGSKRVAATVLSQAATNDSVQVIWQAIGVTGVAVERAAIGKQWQPMAQLHTDRQGRVRYVDRAIEAGNRYRYRLTSQDPGVEIDGGEAWVVLTPIVPARAPKLNVSQESAVMLSLQSGSEVMLEVFDISGRRLVKRQLGWIAEGSHSVEVPEIRGFRPGVYWVRTKDREGISRRKVLIR